MGLPEGTNRAPATFDLDDPAFGRLFDRFARARVVLLGEATHGTSEFYRARAAITRRLIEAYGNAAATEMGLIRGEINIGQLCRERFGDRRDLPAGDGVCEPLLRRLAAAAIRRLCVVRGDARRHAAADHGARGRA